MRLTRVTRSVTWAWTFLGDGGYGSGRVKLVSEAAERNRDPILAVLSRVVPASGTVLEVASGSGQHVVHFARALPHLTWQPSDADPAARASIQAWAAEAALANVLAPLALDAASDDWPLAHADAMVCCNMVHISPWAVALGLFRGAGRILGRGAPLVLYGPFRFEGRFTAPSNEGFDRSLRERDPAWGVRDVVDLEAAARGAGLALEETIAMPANNHSLVFRRA